METTILIIEDDQTLCLGLKDNFTMSGYKTVTACTGDDGLDKAVDLNPDLIILDIMLPGINGYEICRSIRNADLDMPIIMLTAKDRESDIILGLNLGADDYVTKPFSIRELKARVQALLRRRKKEDETEYYFGEFCLKMNSRQLLRNGTEIELTPKEFGVLELFVKKQNIALTRDQILNAVWGYDIIVTQRSIDRCINTLRDKIEVDSQNPRFIKTIRSIGYRFTNTQPEQSHFTDHVTDKQSP